MMKTRQPMEEMGQMNKEMNKGVGKGADTMQWEDRTDPMSTMLDEPQACADAVDRIDKGMWAYPDVSFMLRRLIRGETMDPVLWQSPRTDLLVVITRALASARINPEPNPHKRKPQEGAEYLRLDVVQLKAAFDHLVRSGFVGNDREHRTGALHAACLSCQDDLIAVLLTAGANPAAKDAYGFEPLRLLSVLHKPEFPGFPEAEVRLRSALARQHAHGAMKEIREMEDMEKRERVEAAQAPRVGPRP